MKMIDLHCDTLLRAVLDETPDNVSFLRKNEAMVDLEKLKHSNSLSQFFALFIPTYRLDQIFNGKYTPYEFAKLLHKCYIKELALNKDLMAHANNYDDIMKNAEDHKISSFLTIEDGGIIEGQMDRLDELYTMGIRLITLTWNHENCMGYPQSTDPIIMQSGLKKFGFETIERMNDLGMIIDVSHLSDAGFWDVIKHSKKPFTASHSNSRALTKHNRNMTDEMIIATANAGGVIGINFCPEFVYDENTSKNNESKVSDLIKHIKHIKNIGGIDVLALGSDFDGIRGELEIENAGQVDKLYQALERDGFTDYELEKIWFGNALRMIKDTL